MIHKIVPNKSIVKVPVVPKKLFYKIEEKKFSLEKTREALIDANHALDKDRLNIKAILVKADALFAGGNFERGRTASAFSRENNSHPFLPS